MGEDALNDGRVLDRGDELHPPGTARTAQDVQVESSVHERRPRQVTWRARASAPCLGRCRARIRRVPDIRAVIGDDIRPPLRVRGQHTVVKKKVDLGPWRQGRKLLENLHRLEE